MNNNYNNNQYQNSNFNYNNNNNNNNNNNYNNPNSNNSNYNNSSQQQYNQMNHTGNNQNQQINNNNSQNMQRQMPNQNYPPQQQNNPQNRGTPQHNQQNRNMQNRQQYMPNQGTPGNIPNPQAQKIATPQHNQNQNQNQNYRKPPQQNMPPQQQQPLNNNNINNNMRQPQKSPIHGQVQDNNNMNQQQYNQMNKQQQQAYLQRKQQQQQQQSQQLNQPQQHSQINPNNSLAQSTLSLDSTQHSNRSQPNQNKVNRLYVSDDIENYYIDFESYRNVQMEQFLQGNQQTGQQQIQESIAFKYKHEKIPDLYFEYSNRKLRVTAKKRQGLNPYTLASWLSKRIKKLQQFYFYLYKDINNHTDQQNPYSFYHFKWFMTPIYCDFTTNFKMLQSSSQPQSVCFRLSYITSCDNFNDSCSPLGVSIVQNKTFNISNHDLKFDYKLLASNSINSMGIDGNVWNKKIHSEFIPLLVVNRLLVKNEIQTPLTKLSETKVQLKRISKYMNIIPCNSSFVLGIGKYDVLLNQDIRQNNYQTNYNYYSFLNIEMLKNPQNITTVFLNFNKIQVLEIFYLNLFSYLYAFAQFNILHLFFSSQQEHSKSQVKFYQMQQQEQFRLDIQYSPNPNSQKINFQIVLQPDVPTDIYNKYSEDDILKFQKNYYLKINHDRGQQFQFTPFLQNELFHCLFENSVNNTENAFKLWYYGEHFKPDIQKNLKQFFTQIIKIKQEDKIGKTDLIQIKEIEVSQIQDEPKYYKLDKLIIESDKIKIVDQNIQVDEKKNKYPLSGQYQQDDIQKFLRNVLDSK